MDSSLTSQAQLAAFLLAHSNLSQQQQQHPPLNLNLAQSAFDPTSPWAAQEPLPEFSPAGFNWLQTQLNALAHEQPPHLSPPVPPPPHLPLALPQQPLSPPAPAQPHAFPPISSSRFHPYSLPAERVQRSQSEQQLPPPANRPAPRPRWPTDSAPAPAAVPIPPPTARQPVLYPPQDSPAPILLSDETSPRSHSSVPPSSIAHPVPAASSIPYTRPTSPGPSRRRRTRSAPSSPTVASSKEETLDSLFSFLDEQRWSLSGMLTALSDVPRDAEGRDTRSVEHRRRMDEFLELDDPPEDDDAMQGQSWAARLRRLRKERGEAEKGPDEVVRLWEELGGLGRRRQGSTTMEGAVRELHMNVHEGPVAGSAIRRIINRYGEAYNEAKADIARLDVALSRPPSPHLSSAPREPTAWTGVLVIPPTQADVLQGWLMSPGRPSVQEERGRGGIEADHMRIYSSLSPLDLHARGAELCRVILSRDPQLMALYGHDLDRLHLFHAGPSLAPLDTHGFAAYDDYSLWHHALMCYLQLCVRYPAFRDGKDATIVISPDLPPPVHPTALESSLVDRALHDHWDYLRLYLLNSHGGLLRSAVRAFAGVKLSKVDLLSVCDDTRAVIGALGRSRKNASDRILPYDPSVSQVRNAWRNQAFWDPQADWVVWSAATTHFLELSALCPDWAQGTRELPGLGSLLGNAASSPAEAAAAAAAPR
ncbi:hypothetical protein JCM1841_005622 [Sporobolomyces salmonicolor]